MTDKRRAATAAMRLEHREGGRRIVVDGFADDRRYVSPPSDELATSLILLVDRETTGRAAIGLDDDLGADKKLQVQARAWVHAMRRISRNFRDPELTDQANNEELFSMRTGGMALLTRPIGRLARWVAAVTVDHERASVDTTVIMGSNTTRTPASGDVTIIEPAADAQFEQGPWKLDGSVGVAVPIGIEADPWPEAKLTAQYTQRYGTIEAIGARKGRVPSLRERFQGTGANIALDPEQAWHAEVRLTGRPSEGIEILAAPYVRRTTGTVKVGMDNLLVNLGELNVRGVDFSAKATIARFAIGASYNYATAESEDLGPDPLDRFPAHRADGWLQVRPIDRLSLLARARYIGRAMDRGVETPAYVLWEASATLTIRPDWLVVMRGDDLLDVAPETRTGYHQPGRVISLIAQRSW